MSILAPPGQAGRALVLSGKHRVPTVVCPRSGLCDELPPIVPGSLGTEVCWPLFEVHGRYCLSN